jgi:hypothetical protein
MRLRTSPWRSLVAALLVAAPLLLGGLITSGHGDEDDAESTVRARSRVGVKNGVVVLTLTAAEQQDAGIVTARPPPAPAQSVLIGYGSVLDAAGLTDLSSRYQDALSSVQTAEAKLAVARAAYERAKVLHQDQQNVSTAQLQDAEGAFRMDRTALAAAQSRLNNVMASAKQDWGNVLGEALISQAPLIANLVDRRDYLIKVTLSPDETMATPPATATTRLKGGPDIPLDFISPATSTDPKLQGLSYFYKATAQSGVLPGFHLDVSLTTHAADSRMVVVPEAAIIWLQGKAWVYRRIGPTTFERREISPDRAAPDGGYMVSDLTSDAQIVVRGAQMLLSEEFRAQAPIED